MCVFECVGLFWFPQSVSDDSVEFGGGPKRPSVLDSLGKTPPLRVERQKTPPTTRPWWQDEDDDDDDELGECP